MVFFEDMFREILRAVYQNQARKKMDECFFDYDIWSYRDIFRISLFR